MFCNEFYAIASFILFSVENKIYFAFFKLEWVSCESNILEDFYNDLDDETFLGHEFGAEWEDESNISCSSSYTDVDLSDKDTDRTSTPVDEEDLVPRKQTFENLDDVLDLNNYDVLPPQNPNYLLLLFWHKRKICNGVDGPQQNKVLLLGEPQIRML